MMRRHRIERRRGRGRGGRPGGWGAWRVVLAVGIVAGAASFAGAGVTLVEDGRYRVSVVASEELFVAAERVGQFDYHADRRDGAYGEVAIRELEEHLALVGEGELEVLRVEAPAVLATARARADAGRAVIVLAGERADPDLAAGVRGAHREGADPDRESFGLEVADGVVKVVGLSPKGTLNGAYEVLEQLGFRWYMPGEFGRVLPEGDTLAIAAQRSLEVPSLLGRRIHGSGMQPHRAWMLRARNSVWDMSASHGLPPYATSAQRRALFEQHPDHFRLIDGERAPGQLCLTHSAEHPEDPEENQVLAFAIEAAREHLSANPHSEFYRMNPNDGSGWCECGPCRALDSGAVNPFSGRLEVTDRYMWFYNQVLKHIGEEFPDVRIATLVYADKMFPPRRVVPDPRIAARVALIHLCRIHGPNNPVCPEAHSYRTITEAWAALGVPLHDSGYWFNLADPGLPFMMMHRMSDEIPFVYASNHKGFSRSAAAQWANEGPSLWLASKLMWDHAADVDALLAEFFARFYGPAAEPMERYTMMLDAALRDADHHVGRTWGLLAIYDEPVRVRARELLAEAGALVDGGMYATRVRAAAQGWEYFEAFAEMVESRRRHDYVRSEAAAERGRELIEVLTTDYDVPLLRVTGTSADQFWNRLAGHASTTRDAYLRVTGENELIVGLDAVWDVFQDPQGLGETMGLYREDLTGGNFKPTSTSVPWGDEGWRYYFGEAWYRQRFELPAAAADHDRLMIWFAQVDREARVWINGQPVGEHSGVAPFALEATDVLRPGETNVIAVRAIRPSISELGTGGILGPVMIYAEGRGIEGIEPDRRDIEAELNRIRERGW